MRFSIVGVRVLGFRHDIIVRDFVVVEIAHEFGGAPLFHDAFQAAPGRFRALGRAPPLRLDVAHYVIDVNLIAAGGHILDVLFLEFVRFRLFAHDTGAL